MTMRPLRPCIYPGCRAYASAGGCYCDAHQARMNEQRAARNKMRPTSTQMGYNSRWAQARKAFITAHPLCAECLKKGKYTPATDVDHIVPHKGNKILFWNRNNWQSLCHSCHSRKTAKEDGGYGNKNPWGGFEKNANGF